jgi:hypothetical protein
MRSVICLLGGLCITPLAQAAIDSVKVDRSRPYEKASGYTYAELTVAGTVRRADGSVGQYSVPAIMIFPRNRCGNDVGVVDWHNSAAVHFFPATVTEKDLFDFTLASTGNHLFEQGYTYLSIQWNKAATEKFGPRVPQDGNEHNHMAYGTIERGADAWEILRDAARLLKDPARYPGKHRPGRVDTVLSSGYSQGAALQLELIAERLDPTRVYDGHLVQMIGFVCWKRDDVAPNFGFIGACNPLPTRGNHAPVMMLTSETDMVAYNILQLGKGGYFTRNETNPNWRQYEMAGVAHIPESIFPLGLPDQNTADARPLFRAAFDNLARWARRKHGHKPPPSRFFHGHIDASDAFVPTTDADGHYAGGVRLPHVESQVHGRVAGAPLGNHGPINSVSAQPFPFVFLSGTFTRFSDQELLARYPTRHWYVKRVRRAADELEAKNYITRKDRKALIAAAEDEPLYASDFVETGR